MRLDSSRGHFLMHQRARLIIGAESPFLHHHFNFLGELLFCQHQVAHPVRFQLHRQRQPGLMQLLEIGGVIAAGESILASACRSDQRRKFAAGKFLRTLEHHMFQHMGHAGDAIYFINASRLVPDLRDYHR